MDRSRTVCLAGVMGAALAASANAALLSQWSLQEGSGTVAADSGGSVQNNLALDANTGWSNTGPTNLLTKSLDGSDTYANPSVDKAKNTTAFSASSGDFTGTVLSGGYTITGWIKQTAASNDQRFFGLGGDSQAGSYNNRIAYLQVGADGKLTGAVRTSSDGALSRYGAALSSGTFLNTWWFVAMTFDGNDVKLYVSSANDGINPNANLVSLTGSLSGTATGAVQAKSATYVTIGSAVGGSGGTESDFVGLMADFRVYSGAMSQSAIYNDVYKTSFVPEPTSLGLLLPGAALVLRRRRKM